MGGGMARRSAVTNVFSLLEHRSATFPRFVLGTILALALAGIPLLRAEPADVFSITNIESSDPVASGQQLTYTITVVNTGGAKVNNVVLSDQVNGVGGIGVPPQLVLTSTRGGCGQNGNLVTCNAGSIEGFGTWTVTIRGIVTAPNGTTLNNTALVTGTKSAQNHSSQATATTLVSGGSGSPLPDLTIAKTGPTSVPISSAMTYTLTVNNVGTAAATDVKVLDTVPAGLTAIGATGTSLFTCGVVGQTVTCTGGAVNQGSNATITINALSPGVVGAITNTAVVDPDNAIIEGNELNNTSALVNTQVTSGPAPPAITIVKTDDPAVLAGAGPDPVVPGGQLTYKILLTNNSSTRADDVVIVDGTQSLEAASITVAQVITDGALGPHNGCTVSAPEVRCVIRSLNPGGTLLVTISGQVVGSAGSTIFNTATGTANIANQGVSATDTEITTVKPAVDLTITKGDSPDPVCARSWPADQPPAVPTVCRGGLTYNFVVGNSGIATATNVVVRDQLPPDTFFDRVVPAAIPCVLSAGNVLTCTLASVPPEAIVPFSIVLVAPSTTGPILNTVTVDPNNAIFEADETNNVATQGTQVATGVDLTILKTDAPPGFEPIATNGTQTYTITVDNIGTQDAANIHVRDVLPAGTIFRSAVGDNGFTCSHASGVVDCVGGSLRGTAAEYYDQFGDPGDDTAIITIRIFARSTVGSGVDAMHNEVRVDPFNAIPEVNENNNIDFEDTNVTSGGAGQGAFNQLTIDKTQVSPENPVARNALVTYRIVVGNDGTDPALNVLVRDFIPAGSTFIEATGTNQFLCTHLSNSVDCAGGTIPAGGNATLTIKVFAPDTPGSYTNQSIADPNGTLPEGNEFDNEDSVTTVVENGGNGPFNDLHVDKSGSTNVAPNGEITYSLQVFNTGSNPALNVMVRDSLPAGTTFVSAADAAPGTPGAFTCSHSGGTVECTGATINAGGVGAARVVTIKVTAPNQNTVLTNQAFVDPDNAVPEGDELNNTDTHVTTVASVINLKITKEGPDKATQNQVREYKLKVKNEKPSGGGSPGQTAFDVKVHDPLPVGLIPLAVDAGTSNNWACQILENPINVVDCVGDLNPDQEVTITITVFITAENNRSLDNEACVDPADEIEEFDPPGERDNCSTATTPLVPDPKSSPDLLVTKTADVAIGTPGQDVTYTITIENIGNAPAKSPLTLTDDLPDQVAFVSAAGTNGWTCAEASGIVTCNDGGSGLAVGASAEITLVVNIDITASLPIANTAVAALALVDPAPSDTLENETSIDNNDSTVVVSIGAPGFDLTITDIVDSPDPAIRGNQLSYTVVAVNGGSETAADVHVSIDVPSSGLTFLNAAGTNGFTCGAPVSNTIDCVGTLAGGGSTVITVNFFVHLTASDNFNIAAEIDRPNTFTESVETNNTATEVTTVAGESCIGTVTCVDLVAVQATGAPDPVAPGNQATYSVTVVNIGAVSTADPSVNAAVEKVWFDLFGDVTNVTPTSSSGSFSCSVVSFVAGAHLFSDCTGELAPGQSVTFTVTVTVNSGSGVTVRGLADPEDSLPEVNDFQPRPPDPPETFGNNLVIKVFKVQ
jgi:uncharacterized repeat protein (TIGR01451 family)